MILECVGDGENLEIITRAHGNVADKIGKCFLFISKKLSHIFGMNALVYVNIFKIL